MLEQTPEMAEVCGAFIGDGWIESRQTSMYITGNLTEDRRYYDGHLSKIFSHNIGEVTPKEFPYWHVYGIGFHKKNVIRQLSEFGFVSGRKNRITRIPEWIMNSKDERIQYSALRGIFDTDGSFYCKRNYSKTSNTWRLRYHWQPRIRIGVVSPGLIEDIKTIVDRFGISYSNPSPRPPRKSNEQPAYLFEINSVENIKRWFNEIKPANSRQTTRYGVWRKFGFLPPNTTLEERNKIIADEIDVYSYYAGVSKRSNEAVVKKTAFTQDLLP
ncbi:LAGLIDADG-like domain protein [uncultured archaeon]|nr:LAGLIDADG-like domain protein [uncultured archaeon]